MSPEDDKLQMSKSIDSCLKYFFRKEIVCQETSQNILCLYPPRSCMLLVQGADDDATTSAFSIIIIIIQYLYSALYNNYSKRFTL